MKHLIFTSLAIFYATFITSAQTFQGKAIYMSKTIIDETKIQDKKMSAELQEKLQQALKKAFEKTFTLDFNKEESIYMSEQTLDKPQALKGGVTVSVRNSNDNNLLYKNIKTNLVLTEDESMDGKNYLINDVLQKYDWKILGETKKIGGYNCLKATAIEKVTAEDLARYADFKKQQATKPSYLGIMDEPKDKNIVAWFTNEIPVSHGPDGYWGLPGLILEVTKGKTILLCSKVIINPKDKKEIKAPTKGKKISKKDFTAKEKKLFDSMKDENGIMTQKFTQQN